MEQNFGSQVQKLKKMKKKQFFFVPFFERLRSHTRSYVPVPGNAWKEAVEEGKGGNYGGVVVVFVTAWRACSWRARYGLHNGMLTEAIRQEVRE